MRHATSRTHLLAIPLSSNLLFDANNINYRFKTKAATRKSIVTGNVSMAPYNYNNIVKRLVNSQTVTKSNDTFPSTLRTQINPYIKLIRLDRPIGMYFHVR